jgi:F-box-like
MSTHATQERHADEESGASPVPATELFDLPDEILLHVMHYLTPSEVCTLAQVSRRLTLLADDNVLWARLYQRAFPLSAEARAHPHLARDHFLTLLRERKRLLSIRKLHPSSAWSTSSTASTTHPSAIPSAATPSSAPSSSSSTSSTYVRWKPLYAMQMQERVKVREYAALEKTRPQLQVLQRHHMHTTRDNRALVRVALLCVTAFAALLISLLLLPPVAQP